MNDLTDFAFIRRTVLLKEIIGFGLSGRLRVRVVKQILNTEQDLLDGDCGTPVLLLVKN